MAETSATLGGQRVPLQSCQTSDAPVGISLTGFEPSPGWDGSPTGSDGNSFLASYESQVAASTAVVMASAPGDGYSGASLRVEVLAPAPDGMLVAVSSSLNGDAPVFLGNVTGAGVFMFPLPDATASAEVTYEFAVAGGHPDSVLFASVVFPGVGPLDSVRIGFDACAQQTLNGLDAHAQQANEYLATLAAGIVNPANTNLQCAVAAGASYVVPGFSYRTLSIQAISAPMRVTMATIGGGAATALDYPVGAVVSLEADGVLLNAVTVLNLGTTGQVGITAVA